MSPEFGATATLFPIDDEHSPPTGPRPAGRTNGSGWSSGTLGAQGLWREPGDGPEFDETLELDLAGVDPSVAGPRRPQDRVPLTALRDNFRSNFPNGLDGTISELTGEDPIEGNGVVEEASAESFPASDPPSFAAGDAVDAPAESAPQVPVGGPVDERSYRPVEIEIDGRRTSVRTGSVVIAAITSCTNTSNPTVMVGAGLLARNAVARGLRVGPTVKTSLAPGSKAVTGYLEAAGLMAPLEALGFALAGYGCTTCIGNSGPLDEAVAAAVEANDLVVAAVLSGNRNFEGRIHPLARASYLASPPLVVAFALAGRVDIDLTREPLGIGSDGSPVFLADIWPAPEEIRSTIADSIDPELFRRTYATVFEGDERWRALPIPSGDRYAWVEDSTYIAKPPFFDGMDLTPALVRDITGARVLAVLGDSVTTDHISPAGSIAPWSPAGQWLQEHGVGPLEFNSYGARRGHHEVLVRGTFANIRLRNRLVEGKEGPYTVHLPDGEDGFIYDVAMRYVADGVPLGILAGREYGSGSSRDWAAKGPALLGVRFVLAESYERIHRSNLVGMGILPIQFRPGETAASLGLTGREVYDVTGLEGGLTPHQAVVVRAFRDPAAGGDGTTRRFEAIARLDGPIDVEYYRSGGILPAVLRRLAAQGRVGAGPGRRRRRLGPAPARGRRPAGAPRPARGGPRPPARDHYRHNFHPGTLVADPWPDSGALGHFHPAHETYGHGSERGKRCHRAPHARASAVTVRPCLLCHSRVEGRTTPRSAEARMPTRLKPGPCHDLWPAAMIGGRRPPRTRRSPRGRTEGFIRGGACSLLPRLTDDHHRA